eukprot:CAMPEP_0114977580 /NCGR_PEP_ID=MMETSP0216-20121206/3317_1 /TAXON_ID=223996 /ORGANISM="Protocruzia adherens, Strain Boccale" /LENGTH=1050 /DNA_ID=CAMNT_0002338655 /DNA_START=354 /DNA_END=3503 /DNA_ORIENTATION=+
MSFMATLIFLSVVLITHGKREILDKRDHSHKPLAELYSFSIWKRTLKECLKDIFVLMLSILIIPTLVVIPQAWTVLKESPYNRVTLMVNLLGQGLFFIMTLPFIGAFPVILITSYRMEGLFIEVSLKGAWLFPLMCFTTLIRIVLDLPFVLLGLMVLLSHRHQKIRSILSLREQEYWIKKRVSEQFLLLLLDLPFFLLCIPTLITIYKLPSFWEILTTPLRNNLSFLEDLSKKITLLRLTLDVADDLFSMFFLFPVVVLWAPSRSCILAKHCKYLLKRGLLVNEIRKFFRKGLKRCEWLNILLVIFNFWKIPFLWTPYNQLRVDYQEIPPSGAPPGLENDADVDGADELIEESELLKQEENFNRDCDLPKKIEQLAIEGVKDVITGTWVMFFIMYIWIPRINSNHRLMEQLSFKQQRSYMRNWTGHYLMTFLGFVLIVPLGVFFWRIPTYFSERKRRSELLRDQELLEDQNVELALRDPHVDGVARVPRNMSDVNDDNDSEEELCKELVGARLLRMAKRQRKRAQLHLSSILECLFHAIGDIIILPFIVTCCFTFLYLRDFFNLMAIVIDDREVFKGYQITSEIKRRLCVVRLCGELLLDILALSFSIVLLVTFWRIPFTWGIFSKNGHVNKSGAPPSYTISLRNCIFISFKEFLKDLPVAPFVLLGAVVGPWRIPALIQAYKQQTQRIPSCPSYAKVHYNRSQFIGILVTIIIMDWVTLFLSVFLMLSIVHTSRLIDVFKQKAAPVLWSAKRSNFFHRNFDTELHGTVIFLALIMLLDLIACSLVPIIMCLGLRIPHLYRRLRQLYDRERQIKLEKKMILEAASLADHDGNKQATLGTISHNCLYVLAEHLDIVSISNLAQTHKRFNSILDHRCVWKAQYENAWKPIIRKLKLGRVGLLPKYKEVCVKAFCQRKMEQAAVVLSESDRDYKFGYRMVIFDEIFMSLLNIPHYLSFPCKLLGYLFYATNVPKWLWVLTRRLDSTVVSLRRHPSHPVYDFDTLTKLNDPYRIQQAVSLTTFCILLELERVAVVVNTYPLKGVATILDRAITW